MKNLRNSNATVFVFAILAVAFTSLNSLNAGVLSLADIVGGGDGRGNGMAGAGINMLDGSNSASLTGAVNATNNVFVASSNPFVDGVFVPDGLVSGLGQNIVVSSTGLTVTGISDWSSVGTWDHIRNGNNFGVSNSFFGSSVIGAHASKGITFDLNEMETVHSGLGQASSYNITAGTGLQAATVDFYLFVDGVLKNSIFLTGSSKSSNFSGTLNSSDRFLTLITSPRGSFGSDHSLWVDPTVTLSSVAAVPEPSSVVIVMLLGTASFALRFRRKH